MAMQWSDIIKNKSTLNGAALVRIAQYLDSKNIQVPQAIEENANNAEDLSYLKSASSDEDKFIGLVLSVLHKVQNALPGDATLADVINAVNGLTGSDTIQDAQILDIGNTLLSHKTLHDTHKDSFLDVDAKLALRGNSLSISGDTLTLSMDGTPLSSVTLPVIGGGGDPSGVPVTGITVLPTTLGVQISKVASITARISPSTATNKQITWSSSAPAVASVDANGNVTGHTAGNTTITARTVDGGFTATCYVTVTALVVPVTSIQVDFYSKSMHVGDEITVTATILPFEATNKSIRWTSSQPSVASIDEFGTIRGLSNGTTIIRATAVSDTSKYSEGTVVVTDNGPVWKPVVPSQIKNNGGHTINIDSSGVITSNKDFDGFNSIFTIDNIVGGVELEATRHLYWLVVGGDLAQHKVSIMGLGRGGDNLVVTPDKDKIAFTGQLVDVSWKESKIFVRYTGKVVQGLIPAIAGSNISLGLEDTIKVTVQSETAITILVKKKGTTDFAEWFSIDFASYPNLSNIKLGSLTGLLVGVSSCETDVSMDNARKRVLAKNLKYLDTL